MILLFPGTPEGKIKDKTVLKDEDVESRQKRQASSPARARCSFDVIQEKGILHSPNYPQDYWPNTECTWRITVPENHQVVLKFQSFEIEVHDNCVYDYLEIRDGHESTSPLLGRFCGYKNPEDILSSGNKMTVKFVSDRSVQRAGFAAEFIKDLDECKGDHGCEHECTNTLGGYKCECRIGYELHLDGMKCEDECGGIIEETNGTIKSPSFPDLYPPNKICIWEIIAPPPYRIMLNFTHFDLEGSNQDCEYDIVDIRSKMANDKVRKHGAFCGSTLPPLITSEGNSLRIEFSSDNSVQRTGFIAFFFTGYCRHQITSPYGEIMSPNYPDYYPSRKDCTWLFTTTPGHRIKLVFKDFELESHQECAYDRIAAYDGDSDESPTLGKFCGSKVPPPILASGKRMYLVFKSDASVQRKGFKATHTTVCGGRLLAHRNMEHLYSHARYGDHHYDNKADCDWIVQGLHDQRVKLRFLTFEMEHEEDCGYDYVEVFDGEDDTARSFGKFCGNRVPPEFYSSGNSLMVRFRSDDTINTKGFSAAYAVLDSSMEDDDTHFLDF